MLAPLLLSDQTQPMSQTVQLRPQISDCQKTRVPHALWHAAFDMCRHATALLCLTAQMLCPTRRAEMQASKADAHNIANNVQDSALTTMCVRPGDRSVCLSAQPSLAIQTSCSCSSGVQQHRCTLTPLKNKQFWWSRLSAADLVACCTSAPVFCFLHAIYMMTCHAMSM